MISLCLNMDKTLREFYECICVIYCILLKVFISSKTFKEFSMLPKYDVKITIIEGHWLTCNGFFFKQNWRLKLRTTKVIRFVASVCILVCHREFSKTIFANEHATSSIQNSNEYRWKVLHAIYSTNTNLFFF